MGNKIENDLIKAAWALSKSNVEQWERYLAALDAYTRLWMEKAVASPPDTLHIAVGMARQAFEFNGNMQSLDELNEKIRKAEDKQR